MDDLEGLTAKEKDALSWIEGRGDMMVESEAVLVQCVRRLQAQVREKDEALRGASIFLEITMKHPANDDQKSASQKLYSEVRAALTQPQEEGR